MKHDNELYCEGFNSYLQILVCCQKNVIQVVAVYFVPTQCPLCKSKWVCETLSVAIYIQKREKETSRAKSPNHICTSLHIMA